MADFVDINGISIVQKLPALPEGKSRHFFVSYSCEERDKVIEILDELDRRFPVKCCYSDRDFQAGKDIAVNIKEGMATSIKVLLFVSPSFLQSGWCKYETDAAFVTSMGCGYSCIVPVLLEECEIPPTLVTLTYIDATIPGIDIPAKIASSLLRPNTYDGMLGLNMQSWSKIYENGYCYVINGDREPLWPIRPARYKFVIKQNVLNSMELNKVAVSRRLLKNAFRVINDHSLMWSFDYRNRCKTFLWMVVLIMIPILLLFGLYKSTTELECSSRNPTERKAYGIPLIGVLAPLISLVLSLAICIPIFCSLKRGDISLQTRLWESLGDQCIKNTVLLLFSSRKNNQPTEYLVGIIQSKNLSFINDELTPEEVAHTKHTSTPKVQGEAKLANNLVKSHLAEMTKTLANEFESLPDAPFNRHNVKSGKMCICQQLEQYLIEGR